MIIFLSIVLLIVVGSAFPGEIILDLMNIEINIPSFF